MKKRALYESYHSSIKLQRKILGPKSFTYRNTINVLNKYLKRGIKILDIGCGTGALDFYFAKSGGTVLAIDISENAIKYARLNSEKFGLTHQVKFIQCDFLQKRFNKKFDLIVCSEVIEHLPSDEKAVKKIFRLLNKGGFAFFSSPTTNAPLYKLNLLKDFDKKVGHLRRYTKKSYIDLLKRGGFKIVSIRLEEGIIRNFLFTNGVGGKLIRLIKGPISDLVAFVDRLTIPIFGESNVLAIGFKK